jgi:hypothetical protein
MLTTAHVQTLVKAIVTEQKGVIGPLAVPRANQVAGLKITDDLKSITISASANPTQVLSDLVKQYELLFGQASIGACKEAVKKIMSQIPNQDIPDFLR